MRGQDFVALHDLARGALRDDLAAVHARAGAHINQMVGGANGIFIVFNHNDGVADVAQAAQGFQQRVIVALMQADGRLIEHIQDAGEAGADL